MPRALWCRNRHFRTAFSSKGGMSYILQPTGRYATASGEQLPLRMSRSLSAYLHIASDIGPAHFVP